MKSLVLDNIAVYALNQLIESLRGLGKVYVEFGMVL